MCLSFSKENDHPLTLFSCSSLSTSQLTKGDFTPSCCSHHAARPHLPKFLFHICGSHCSGRPSTVRLAKPRVFYGQSNLSKLPVGVFICVYPLNLGAKILKNLRQSGPGAYILPLNSGNPFCSFYFGCVKTRSAKRSWFQDSNVFNTPGKLTWTCLQGKLFFQTFSFGFHVNFRA